MLKFVRLFLNVHDYFDFFEVFKFCPSSGRNFYFLSSKSRRENFIFGLRKWGRANYIIFLNIMVHSRSNLARSVLFIALIVLFSFHKPLFKW